MDQNTFRDVMYNIFALVTEETLLERLWLAWDRGGGGGGGGSAGGSGASEGEMSLNKLFVIKLNRREDKTAECTPALGEAILVIELSVGRIQFTCPFSRS
ncbi:hypothetical protein EVAR_22352_1 [Eumeta japonica]|uniref:Uncharacterized protein n=1 Tax=Eumeta variegata TaxID=151549 RepID=A0A4C1VJE7_EUMVA|nr:hypothetical protein EVAR_22352_1 [Eumeta japonica]